jgi:predicted butyrate kinase (DUF1464 family)
MPDAQPVLRLTCHKGHRYYVGGGSMDGQVTHLVHASPSDYPQTIGTQTLGAALGTGSRSWYELDYEASEGTEAVYRFVGIGKNFPQRTVDDV